jgi:thioredoxin-related protein/copper chaperone CopZ
MANSITNAPLGLLAALLVAVALPAHAREVPEWFAETILDVRDEAADAAKRGKRVMLYFWLEGCPYCQRMTSTTFRDPAVAQRLKRGFVPVGINIRGDRDIGWSEGATLTEKQLAAALDIRGTPTLVFLDANGATASRLTGYLTPAQFMRALEGIGSIPVSYNGLMDTVELKVEGMDCEGCVKSVTRMLSAVPGVQKIDVSLAEARAKVTYDPTKASVPDMKKAVERAGYKSP